MAREKWSRRGDAPSGAGEYGERESAGNGVLSGLTPLEKAEEYAPNYGKTAQCSECSTPRTASTFPCPLGDINHPLK